MRRTVVRGWLLAAALTQTGCLTLSSGTNPAPAPPPPSAAMLPSGKSADLCVKLGESLSNQGYLAEACLQYERARQFNSHMDVAHQLAVLYDQRGEDAQALVEYQKALAAHPRDADLHNDVGYYYCKRGQFAEAEKCLREAIALNPEHPHAWVNLGLALAQQNRLAESVEAFTRVLKPAEAQCNVGLILARNGETGPAREAFQHALALDPGMKLAHDAIARLDTADRPATGSADVPRGN